MKRIFMIATLMLTAILTAQTQTFTGTKTFASPPKIKALVQNDANTKVLTVNGTDIVQWRDVGSLLNTFNLKKPQDYGAVGDGVADDTAAIQQCINNNSAIALVGKYKTSSAINFKSNLFIISYGAIIENKLDFVKIIIANNINNFEIKGNLTLIGNGKYDNNTNVISNTKVGLYLNNCFNYNIDGLKCIDIQGFGIWIDGTRFNLPDERTRKVISNFSALNCYYGVQTYLTSRSSEYVEFVSVNICNCNFGFTIVSGNITITGGNINNNNIGIYLESQLNANGAHGIIDDLNVNHNVTNIMLVNVDLGQTISNCHFYGDALGSIVLNNCIGVNFSNCIIDGKIEATTGSLAGKNIFSNCHLEPDVTINATSLAKVKFINCYNRNATPYINNSSL